MCHRSPPYEPRAIEYFVQSKYRPQLPDTFIRPSPLMSYAAPSRGAIFWLNGNLNASALMSGRNEGTTSYSVRRPRFRTRRGVTDHVSCAYSDEMSPPTWPRVPKSSTR